MSNRLFVSSIVNWSGPQGVTVIVCGDFAWGVATDGFALPRDTSAMNELPTSRTISAEPHKHRRMFVSSQVRATEKGARIGNGIGNITNAAGSRTAVLHMTRVFQKLWSANGLTWRLARIILMGGVVSLILIMAFEDKLIYFPTRYPDGLWGLP